MDFVELRKFINEASKELDAWPAWKRGILEASLKPMNDEPRKAVNQIERVRTMKIEGVPEGWELVRIGQPLGGELYLGHNGAIVISTGSSFDKNCPILRKMEKPKQYRPFADAEEFKPHRDRWCKIGDCWSRVQIVTDIAIYFSGSCFNWGDAFKAIMFDDGTPFGVEVGE